MSSASAALAPRNRGARSAPAIPELPERGDGGEQLPGRLRVRGGERWGWADRARARVCTRGGRAAALCSGSARNWRRALNDHLPGWRTRGPEAGADHDPGCEREREGDRQREQALGRPRARGRWEADIADWHDQCTVLPRFSKKLTIAGAAPTRKAATAEMIVPRRPALAW